jgi:hypothetical protein
MKLHGLTPARRSVLQKMADGDTLYRAFDMGWFQKGYVRLNNDQTTRVTIPMWSWFWKERLIEQIGPKTWGSTGEEYRISDRGREVISA